jgi:crotonobetainyl-CoA:carnitine CoA-transferase CaiB-like acyl-CoA transferase
VVEVASRIQGPLAGLLLQMLGAEVVKVEPPGGDGTRLAPPAAGAASTAFLAYNRGKHSVEIDYKTPGGRRQLLELVGDADVFLQNWPSERAAALGFDADDLAAVGSGLVYAHASGWGEAGRGLATEYLVQAHAGCGHGLNPPGEAPLPSPVTLSDVTGGLLACEAILAGLHRRGNGGNCGNGGNGGNGGRGWRVDTSLFASAMALQAPLLEFISRRRPDGQVAGAGRPWGPLSSPLPTADGLLVVDDRDGDAVDELGRLCTPAGAPRPSLAALSEGLHRRSAREWASALAEHDVGAAAVCTDLSTLPADHRVRGLLEWVDDGCWAPGPPWRFQR